MKIIKKVYERDNKVNTAYFNFGERKFKTVYRNTNGFPQSHFLYILRDGVWEFLDNQKNMGIKTCSWVSNSDEMKKDFDEVWLPSVLEHVKVVYGG